MRKLEEVISKKINPLYYGNRVLLPFMCDILKIVIEKDIITDFSSSKKGAEYYKRETYTEIYFHDYDDLEDYVTKYETIKMIIVEAGQDVFDFSNHIKIAFHVKEKHILEMELLNDNYLFIE
ncbi:MAG: hypothetical protein CVV23_11040 [Ignavibacteriae bacterium HGW-Ignavibacteriae-2]|nr:hypothetical protein [Bacteroidota bacterium]PKL88264.1 MAG: hypothetical protein CVV23_11040 [Ignavibacteriae bacterium HGW-Ignavibacteriae-2]